MSALTTGWLANRGKGEREYGEKRPTDDGLGTKWVRLGIEHAELELWIDARSLFRQFGERAMRSKSKKRQACSGAVVVKAVNVRRTPDPAPKAKP